MGHRFSGGIPSGGPSAEPLLRDHMPELDSVRGVAILARSCSTKDSPGPVGLSYSGVGKLFMYAALPGWLGASIFCPVRLLDNRSVTEFKTDVTHGPDDDCCKYFYSSFCFSMGNYD